MLRAIHPPFTSQMVSTRNNGRSKPSGHVSPEPAMNDEFIQEIADFISEGHDDEAKSGSSSRSPGSADDIKAKEGNDVDEEDNDDDEAPEEESISAARKVVYENKRKAEEVIAKEKQAKREKRRQLAEHNTLQQQAKREKKSVKASTAESLPDLLPDDLLQELGSSAFDTPAPNKHLRVRDLDERDQRALKQKRIEEKLAKIKSLKNTAVKKGPINVRVHKSGDKHKAVPRAESKIVNSRDQWLKRKSLNRK